MWYNHFKEPIQVAENILNTSGIKYYRLQGAIIMRLCFSTLGCTEKSLTEIVSLAKQYGIEALEFRGIDGVLDHRKIPDFAGQNLDATKKLLSEQNVRPLGVNSSCSFHDPDLYDALIEEAKTAIDLAKKLGAKFVRVFGNKITDGSNDAVIRGLNTLCDYARGSDVRVLLEVHGDYNSIEALSPIVDALKENAYFGLLWDIGHTHPTYGENWVEFYNKFRACIYHVHIKDRNDEIGRFCMLGKGNIPITAIIKHLLDDGYEGYFSLEWEKLWIPELPVLEEALPVFLKLLPACRQ